MIWFNMICDSMTFVYRSTMWYEGYDDFISMNNVFVFVLIIIIFLLVLLLANVKMNILEKSPFSISHELFYFSLFLLFVYFCISSIYIFLINFCFSFFLSSGVFICSQTLILFFFLSFLHSLSLLVFLFVILSLSLLVCITVSHFMILLDLIWCIVWFDIVFDNMILCIRMYYYRVWYW